MENARIKQLHSYYPGIMIYHADDKEFITARVIKYNESNETIYVVAEKGGFKFHVSLDDMIKDWTIINPDAIITFTIAKLLVGEDIIVCMHPMKDIHKAGALPQVICRQSIVDVFTTMAHRSGKIDQNYNQYNFVGMSITPETCPNNIDYNTLLACNEVLSTNKVAYYIGDTIIDTLSFLRARKKYDDILKKIHYQGELTYRQQGMFVTGFNDSLKELLRNTRFSLDIEKYFHIHEVSRVPDEARFIQPDEPFYSEICGVLQQRLTSLYFCPYTRDINLDDIGVAGIDYCFIIPIVQNSCNNRVGILKYTSLVQST